MGLDHRDGIGSVAPERRPSVDIDIALGEALGRALGGTIRSLQAAELAIRPGGGAGIAWEEPARLLCSSGRNVEALERSPERASHVLKGVPAKLLEGDGHGTVTQVR